ncbi:hypothetical protein O181_021959 [Austropuccinia psidii MF-1]|uniref:Uncharacterized protein n=1 Tax=Austropuccinia psidii MF-1 TaxID=1389203 RepID=A0A9Q3GX69_9BASI|nr:hypothetical protein [Austropuccinia psidii MF-1]
MKNARESQMLVAGQPKLSSIVDTAKNKQWGIGKRGIEVSEKIYRLMLQLLKRNGENMGDFKEIPHPKGTWTLSCHAQTVCTIKVKQDGDNILVKAPNNVVVYKQNNTFQYGMIKNIYNFYGPNHQPVTGILLQIITNLYPRTRYLPGTIGNLLHLFGIVVGSIKESQQIMILATDVVSLAAYCYSNNKLFSLAPKTLFLSPQNRSIPF